MGPGAGDVVFPHPWLLWEQTGRARSRVLPAVPLRYPAAEFQLQTHVGVHLQFFMQPTCQNSPSTERLGGKRTAQGDKCSASLARGARVPSSLTLQVIRGLMDVAAARFPFKLLPIMASV